MALVNADGKSKFYLIQFCFPEFFKNPQLVMQTINSPDSSAALFCYFVIMEANYDPYTVTERF